MTCVSCVISRHAPQVPLKPTPEPRTASGEATAAGLAIAAGGDDAQAASAATAVAEAAARGAPPPLEGVPGPLPYDAPVPLRPSNAWPCDCGKMLYKVSPRAHAEGWRFDGLFG